MSEETTGSATEPTESAEQPTGNDGVNVDKIQSELKEYQQRAEKAEQDLGKVREFYSQYPDLVKFARKYAEDPDTQQFVQAHLSGQSPQPKESQPDLSELDPDTQKVVQRIIDDKLKEYTAPYEQKFNKINESLLTQQIKEWRNTYTKENGYPVDFKEVEPQVAEMLQKGEAVSAEGAYKQLAADYYRKNKAEVDKELKEYKQKASMARTGLPTSMPTRNKGSRKELAEAYAEALEEVGQV